MRPTSSLLWLLRGRATPPALWVRLLASLAAATAATAVAALLHPLLGREVSVLMLVPTVVVGWLWGWRAGLASGLLLPLTAALVPALEVPSVLALLLFEGVLALVGCTIGALTGALQHQLGANARARDALHASEQRYRRLVEMSPDALLVHQRGLIVYANPACERLCRVKSPGDLLGFVVFDLVHPDSKVVVRERLASLALPNAHEPVLEERLVRPDGSAFSAEVTATAILWDGEPAVQTIVRDITVRQAAQQAERAYAAELQRLMHAAQRQAQELALLDEVRTALTRAPELPDLFRTVVEAIAANLGYTQVSLYLLEDDTLTLQHQVGYDNLIARVPIGSGVISRVVTSGLPVLLEDVRTDPAFIYAIEGIVSELAVPLFDQRRVVGVLNVESTAGLTLTDSDLTLIRALSSHVNIAIERARLLREAQERAHLLESITDAFIALDRSGRFTYINAKAADYLARIGHPTTPERANFLALARTAQPPLDETILAVIDAGRPWSGEVWFETVGVWFALHCYPTAGGAALYAQDVSARKRALEEHLALQHRLMEAQKLESLGVLAGGVAHDFNNLLQVIAGQTQLAQFDLPPGSPAEGALDIVQQACARAADLTRQLLAYVGKGRTMMERIDLNSALSEGRALLQTAVADEVQLVFAPHPQPLRVEADITQLRQVVMNLVINAAEAMAGRGTITLRTTAAQLDAATLRTTFHQPTLAPGHYALLAVRDTGSGMDEATLMRIFDPFFTTKFTGRGLGLAAIQGIARTHGGAIHVASAVGVGSVFTLLLPLLSGASG